MKLQVDEKIIKTYHHHALFFFWRGLKVWAAVLPFLFLTYMFRSLMPFVAQMEIYSAIIIIFAIVHAYDFLMFYLDTLIITNQRVVHLDWINPFKYLETQAMLDDIQNVESEENGFLSEFKIFDFGEFLIETASTRTVISFEQAPDPEGIKFFVTDLSRRHAPVEQNGGGKAKLTTDEAYKISQNTEKHNSTVAS
jgi:hypothetical protein